MPQSDKSHLLSANTLLENCSSGQRLAVFKFAFRILQRPFRFRLHKSGLRQRRTATSLARARSCGNSPSRLDSTKDNPRTNNPCALCAATESTVTVDESGCRRAFRTYRSGGCGEWWFVTQGLAARVRRGGESERALQCGKKGFRRWFRVAHVELE